MTTTPTSPRLAMKVRRVVWVEDEHPRDRKGRFIETGAEVRIWGGLMGWVVRNVGGGRIEVKRSDGKNVIVHRNYLTVTARPDGTAPTDKRDANPAALRAEAASPDAQEIDAPTTRPDVAPDRQSQNLYDLLESTGDTETAALVRQAAADYSNALDNAVPDDEADERDGLLAVLDDVEAEWGENDEYIEAIALLREAAEAEPPAPQTEFTPVSRRLTPGGARQVATAVDEHAGDAGVTVDGQQVTVTDPDAARAFVGGALPLAEMLADNDSLPEVMRSTFVLRAESLRTVEQMLDTDAKPVYSGRNDNGEEGAPDESAVRTDGGEALAGVPSGAVRGSDGPDGLLPADGRGGSGAGGDTGRDADDFGARGPREPGGDVRRAVEPDGAGAARSGGTGGEGVPPADAGARGDTDAGGRGTDGSDDGVRDAEGRSEGDAGRGEGGSDAAGGADEAVAFEKGDEVFWQNPDAEDIISTRRGWVSHYGDSPGTVYIDYDRAPTAVERRRGVTRPPRQRTLVMAADLSAADPDAPSPAEVDWRTRNEPGYIAPADRVTVSQDDIDAAVARLDFTGEERNAAVSNVMDAITDDGLVPDTDSAADWDMARLAASERAAAAAAAADEPDASSMDGDDEARRAFDEERLFEEEQERLREADDEEFGSLGDIDVAAMAGRMDLSPEEREQVNRAIAARVKPADADDLAAEADPVDVRPTDAETVTANIIDGTGPGVGSWTTRIDAQANEGVIKIKGDYGITGEIRAGIDGWVGWLGEPGKPPAQNFAGTMDTRSESISDRDPQVVLDRLYDSVNGPGAADRTRNEVTQGRPAAPEVGRDWTDLTDGARIRITPHEAEYQYASDSPTGQSGYVAKPTGGDPFDAVFVSYQPPSSYQPYGFVTYRPDGEDNENVQRRSAIPAGLLPEPAAPVLGDEAPEMYDSDDSDDDYAPDPYAVPVLDRDSVRFAPGGIEDFAPAGVMAKVDANIAALRVLRTLRTEGRPATSDEQAVLARWAGWGGVAGVFDTDKPEFAARLAEIESLLDPVEMRRAKRTTVNAHYTDPRVVEQVWGTLRGLGFDGGRVLEPGSGSGTFVGYRPEGTDVVGVEWDSTTAAISKYLYPDADIRNESFAETLTPDNAFDATIGNVPFGNFALTDTRHNRDGESIHNHFILKSLAMTRPGGVVSVMSSRYTLDSLNDRARRKIYESADLVGAVRFPNGSHQRIAGTDVIEDLLIFRKRLPGETPGDDSWLTSRKQDINGWEVSVNDYFTDTRPDRVLGTLTAKKGRFGGEVAVDGDVDTPDLGDVLAGIVEEAQEKGLTVSDRTEPLPALLSRRLGRYEGNIAREDDGTYTIAASGAAEPFTVPNKGRPEFDALLGVRDALMALLDAEATDDPAMDDFRATLNERYDAYVEAYGPLNRFTYTANGSRKRAPIPRLFAMNDPKGAVVNALEAYTPPNREVPGDTGSASKASIFTTRGVAPRTPQTKTDNPADALTLSMDRFGYINLSAIAEMLDTDEADARARLGNLVFEDPPFTADELAETAKANARLRDDPNLDYSDLGIGVESLREPGTLVPAAEYLSGNVRAKLAAAHIAAAQDPKYRANVESLIGVIPRDLGPDEIDAMLGASWIDAKTVEDFANHMLRVNSWDKRRVQVAHSGGAIWRVEGASIGSTDARTREWGTDARPFHQILQSLLEQRSITVTKDGKQDIEATLAAQAKAEAIQERFREWVWESPDRTRVLTARYNDQFNNLALRQYDGSGRTFEGMSEEWREKVQPHVKNAVERIVNEPTALLAHVVGAGKTAEMVMGTAELKRLGLARKPAIVVPNHMLEQFTREYLEIYPTARILTAGQGMNAEERRTFVAQAAVGDWDAVIMTQGAFEGIPMSGEQIEAYIDREMGTMRAQLELLSAEVGEDGTKANKRTIKAMENALIRAEEALRKKLSKQKDLGVSFEQTGIDYLMVDEAHEYSNLRTLSNIQGAGTTGADRATDLHMKLEYIRAASKTGRVATFATGTPIRNTVTQAYIMQRYMRPDLLEQAGIHSFDQWAATFGQVVEDMELKPEGRGFRQTQRFASFRNVPEFLRMFHTFADVKMAEDLDLPRPNLKGGKAEVVSVPPSDDLRDYIRQLGDRADAVRQGKVDPTEDNMLKISTDGRKAALSMALVTDEQGNYYPHEPGKLEAAADQIAKVYDQNVDKVYANPKTGEPDELPGAFQVVFMDLGTPKDSKSKDDEASVDDNDADFVAYDKLKAELVARGIPAEKIRYMHEAKDDAQKAELFAAAREGRISVLLGSSAKMGVGTNMQKRAKALHHIDAPWRPADVEQRDGRLHRQGNWHMNMGEDVEIYRYVTEGSFDAYMWQTLERKAKFINQVMRGSLDVREIEDVGDTALSYAEVKAIAVGNPDFLTLAKGETLVTKLQRLQRSHAQTQTNMRAEIGRLTQQSDVLDTNAIAFVNAAGSYQQATDDDGNEVFRFTVIDTNLRGDNMPEAGDITSRTEAGDALRRNLLAVRNASSWGRSSDYSVGMYNGLPLTAASEIGSGGERMVALSVAGLEAVPIARLSLSQLREGQGTALGLMSRLDNYTGGLNERAENLVGRAAQNRAEVASMQDRIGQPFAREGELNAWTAKVERLRAKIQRDDARSEGANIPFDPRIDSDQYDAPGTLASAETYVPPPEIQPAAMEVLATSLMIGDTITIVTGEVSGTTGDGKIISKREAGGLTFVVVEIDGVEYTRAYSADTLVTKVGAVDSVTGVKGLTFERTLSVKDGRVVVQIKRVNLWKEELHPRDRNGRFIETGASVRIWGGGTGTILGMVKGGRVRVKRDADQREVVLDAGNVTVVASTDAPEAPDAPDDAPAALPPNASSPDAAQADQSVEDVVAAKAPSGTTPATEAPASPAATFTGPNGVRAFLDTSEDEPAGYISTGDDEGTLLRFNDTEEWADTVDSLNMTEDTDGGSAESQRQMAADDAAAPPETPDEPAPPRWDGETDQAYDARMAREEAAIAAFEESAAETMANKPAIAEQPGLAASLNDRGAPELAERLEASIAAYNAAVKGGDEAEIAEAHATLLADASEASDHLNRAAGGDQGSNAANFRDTVRAETPGGVPAVPGDPADIAEVLGESATPAAAADDDSPEAAEARMAADDAAAGPLGDSFTEGPEDADDAVQQRGNYVEPMDAPLTVEQVMATHNQPGRPDGEGTIEDPIDVEGDLDKAATLISEGKHVRLNKVEDVSIILEKFAQTAKDLEAAGAKAPEVDLCLISVPGTNLFCQQSKGIPRAQMPQLSGKPLMGSPADRLKKNKKGKVDITAGFIERLEAAGISIEDKDVPASTLKATQNQLNGAKVGGMMVSFRNGTLPEAPIFVTRDGYVIDGHHRWAAKVGVDSGDGDLGDITQPVRMIDMEIGEAIDFTNAFAAEMGIPQAGVGDGVRQADARPDAEGTAKIGDTVATLVESVGRVQMSTDDNTDLPDRLEQAAEEYDTAMESGDARVKADAFLNLSKALTELNNVLDTSDEELLAQTVDERKAALNDLATVVALFDSNVASIFPPVWAGGTDPGLEGKVISDGAVADFFSNAGSESLANGGSAANYLIKGEDGKWRLTVERQALHDSIVGSIVDGVPVSEDPKYNFFGGGPASGKGGITRMFPQLEEDAAYINPDDVKFILPEMQPRARAKDPSASSFVHEESSYLAKVAQAAGFDKGINVTLDGTGNSKVSGVKSKLAAARAKGYTVDAYYVTVPIDVAVARAEWRAENGTGSDRGRAVPRDVIEHAHMAVSEIVPQVVEDFDTFVLFDTNVDRGRPPNLVARKEREQRLEIMMEGNWQEFLDKTRYVSPPEEDDGPEPDVTAAAPDATPDMTPDPEGIA